jgi:hypothetical protein
VSVYGTVFIYISLETFLGSVLCLISQLPRYVLRLDITSKWGSGFAKTHPYDTHVKSNYTQDILHFVIPITVHKSHGILTVYPSGAAFAIPLGPTNPWLIYIAKETLVFRRAGISPALRLLVPTFLLPSAPVWVTPSPSSRMEYSPTACEFHCRNENGTTDTPPPLSPVQAEKMFISSPFS